MFGFGIWVWFNKGKLKFETCSFKLEISYFKFHLLFSWRESNCVRLSYQTRDANSSRLWIIQSSFELYVKDSLSTWVRTLVWWLSPLVSSLGLLAIAFSILIRQLSFCLQLSSNSRCRFWEESQFGSGRRSKTIVLGWRQSTSVRSQHQSSKMIGHSVLGVEQSLFQSLPYAPFIFEERWWLLWGNHLSSAH